MRIYNPATNEYGIVVGKDGSKLCVSYDNDTAIHTIARSLVEVV